MAATRAARAARAVSSAVTKRTSATVRQKANPGKQHSEQKGEGSREDAYDEGSTSSSSLSSLSSESSESRSESEPWSESESEFEFEVSEEEEEGVAVSKYFQKPALSAAKAGSEIKKRKRATRVVKKEPVVGKREGEPTPSLGDIAPAIIKHEGKKKGKGVISTKPPPHWEEMYDAVKEMRSRIPAAVDTMGCERLADGASTPKVRFPRTTRDGQYLTWSRSDGFRR